MLWGSTPTRTGRRWKKISSRQPTRTKVRHAIEWLEDLPGGGGRGLDPAMNGGATGAGRRPRRMASKARVWLRLKPMARAVTANCCCSARELDGLGQPVPELGVLGRRRVLLDQGGRVGPPPCSASTAARTLWAWS